MLNKGLYFRHKIFVLYQRKGLVYDKMEVWKNVWMIKTHVVADKLMSNGKALKRGKYSCKKNATLTLLFSYYLTSRKELHCSIVMDIEIPPFIRLIRETFYLKCLVNTIEILISLAIFLLFWRLCKRLLINFHLYFSCRWLDVNVFIISMIWLLKWPSGVSKRGKRFLVLDMIFAKATGNLFHYYEVVPLWKSHRICLANTIFPNAHITSQIRCALMFGSSILVQMHTSYLKWNAIESTKYKVNHISSQMKCNRINQT